MSKIAIIIFALVAISVNAQGLRNDTIYWRDIAISVNAQELGNDTVYWGNSQIIMPLPSGSKERVHLGRYEEGAYRIYPLIKRDNVLSYIILHCGGNADWSLPDPDIVISKCTLGNVADSIYFTFDDKYYRRDAYYKYGIRVIFYSVAEEEVELANYILDNLKISKVSKSREWEE